LKGEKSMTQKVLIIGGVATGTKAAARIKRRNPDAEVTIIEQGAIASYGACGLPYFISDVVHDQKELFSTPIGIPRDENFFKNVKRVAVYTKTRAEKIDRNNKVVKTVHIETGEKKDFSYDKLILALGGIPVAPPLKGVNLRNIFQLRTIEDGLAIKQYLAKGKANQTVIVGSGLIGMEMAEALYDWGIETSLIEMLDWILPTVFDRDMGLILSRYLEGKGVHIFTSEKVIRFEGDENGAVTRVITDKRELAADMVFLAVGVKPNVDLAKKAGLALGETGALQVNDYLQTNDPDIYAGGDCVENTHRLSGKKIYAPLGSTANKHGRIIADHITGGTSFFPGVLGTAICKVIDFNAAKTGLTEREARAQGFEVETVICPGPDRPHYFPGWGNIIIKLIADRKKGKLLGAQIMGQGDVAKRIEIVVSALSLKAPVKEIATFDLAYAPPFSPAMDNIITAANVLENKLNGIARSLSPLEVREKLEQGGDFIFLDVRSPKEYEELRIDHPKVKLIPLGKLQEELKNLPKDKEVITFCQISLRGYEAQRMLEAHGFKKVKFMEGGVLAWPFEMVGKIWQ
jgi:NADPH-dependent 2,4-dienoyl-CoA reductase/sulfur reductase-like enzyme/rhodanese-related sulfurtransferase